MIHRFNEIPVKITANYSDMKDVMNKFILKFMWKDKRPRIAKYYQRRKRNFEDWDYSTSNLT